jgi:hypothetical protein
MGEEAVLRDEFTFELETACEIELFIWRATVDEFVRFLRDTLVDVATALRCAVTIRAQPSGAGSHACPAPWRGRAGIVTGTVA